VLAKVNPGGKRSDRGGSVSNLPAERAEMVAMANDAVHHLAVVVADTTARRLTAYGVRDATGALETADESRIVA
jgi:hypothetical protein